MQSHSVNQTIDLNTRASLDIDTKARSGGPACEDISPQLGSKSPTVKARGAESSGNTHLSPIRGSWVLNGGLSPLGPSGRGSNNIPPISSLIEPSYLQRIRKYCSLSVEDLNNNYGEDTTESSSQQKNQKTSLKKSQKKKVDIYASSGGGSRGDYRDFKDYKDNKSDY